jgi:FHA domain
MSSESHRRRDEGAFERGQVVPPARPHRAPGQISLVKGGGARPGGQEQRPNTLEGFLSRPTRHVRVLDGPLRGSTHVVWSGIRMGRQPTADVLVLLPEISRQHAELVEDPYGEHWLIDLGSSNGTWVGDQRIERRLLQAGTVFRLADIGMVYEDEAPPPRSDVGGEAATAVSYHDASNRRSTVECRLDGTGLGDTTRATRDTMTPRVRVVEAKGADDMPYPGILVDDLVEYRSLSLRLARKGLDATGELDRLEQLEARLFVQSNAAGGGAWPRSFSCRLPAGMRFADGSSVTTLVVSLGAAGAEIIAPRLPLRVGEVVWLAFELVSSGRSRTVVQTCRVDRIEHESIGLSFVGLASEPAETQEPLLNTRVEVPDEPAQEPFAPASTLPPGGRQRGPARRE